MKELARRKYLRNRRIFELIEKLVMLALAAKARQENFFDMNLNGFRKYGGGH